MRLSFTKRKKLGKIQIKNHYSQKIEQTYLKFVKLLSESSKINEKDAKPTYSNDILGMVLKDLLAKLFSNVRGF